MNQYLATLAQNFLAPEEIPTLLVYRSTEQAQFKKAHPQDAGFDIFCGREITLKPQRVRAINSNIKVKIPPGYYLQIQGRSSLGRKGILTHPGVIDEGYLGDIILVITNISQESIVVPGEQAIAQALLLPVPKVTVQEVPTEFHLGQSERGTQGFGSTNTTF